QLRNGWHRGGHAAGWASGHQCRPPARREDRGGNLGGRRRSGPPLRDRRDTYGTDGTLDANFGSGGIATVDLGGVSDRAAALALEPDGAILVMGAAADPGHSELALRMLD